MPKPRRPPNADSLCAQGRYADGVAVWLPLAKEIQRGKPRCESVLHIAAQQTCSSWFNVLTGANPDAMSQICLLVLTSLMAFQTEA